MTTEFDCVVKSEQHPTNALFKDYDDFSLFILLAVLSIVLTEGSYYIFMS